MRILFGLIFFFFISLNSGSDLFSQILGTPLEPQAPPKQTEVGIVFGMGNNFQSGLYQPKCVTCQFEDAQGFGFTIGGIFIRDISENFQYGSSIVFNSLSVQSSYQKTELVKIETSPVDFEYRPIPFRNSAEFGLGEIAINPFIQWLPFKFIFFRIGFSTSLLTDYNFSQTKELLKFKDTLSTGEIVDLRIDHSNPQLKTIENNPIPGINRLRFCLEPALGFTFEISNQILFNPSFSYTIPFTKLSNLQGNFNVNKWRITFELRLAIKLRNIKID